MNWNLVSFFSPMNSWTLRLSILHFLHFLNVICFPTANGSVYNLSAVSISTTQALHTSSPTVMISSSYVTVTKPPAASSTEESNLNYLPLSTNTINTGNYSKDQQNSKRRLHTCVKRIRKKLRTWFKAETTFGAVVHADEKTVFVILCYFFAIYFKYIMYRKYKTFVYERFIIYALSNFFSVWDVRRITNGRFVWTDHSFV